MSQTPPTPDPGWYPDPYAPDQVRFWDGGAWGAQTYAAEPATPRLGSGFATLGRVIRIGLRLSLLVGVGEVLLYAWGLSMFDDAIAAADLDQLSLFDNVNRVLSISDAVLFVATGVVWLVWQFRLARSITPGDLERSPGWHVGSYFIPVGNLWMPFQNLRDLWRRLVAVDALILGWWWTTVLLSWLFQRIGSAQDASVGLSSLKTEVGWWLASSAVGIVCAALALVIVRRLTIGGLAQAASGGAGVTGPDSLQVRHLPNLRQGPDGPGRTSGSRPIF
ncbi:MAG: DUF4328 domain-containing protein [Marmoricola sp.]